MECGKKGGGGGVSDALSFQASEPFPGAIETVCANDVK